MSFEFTSQHITDYDQLGFTIFRDLIPPKLLSALRIQSDKARAIARSRSGDQAQRLQPVFQFPQIDLAPFDEYRALPQLSHALSRLFESSFAGKIDHQASRETFAILLEPASRPYCIWWHRDWRDNVPGVDLDAWDKIKYDVRYFNQVNCALYQDSSTWVVPGSHLREDTDAEILFYPARPIPLLDTSSMTAEEAEAACLRYARSMPGGIQVRLNAGDYMLYRNTLWHHGNYVPYCKRATIHDSIFTPEFAAFFQAPPIRLGSDGKRATDFAVPNTGTSAYKRWAAQNSLLQAPASHAV